MVTPDGRRREGLLARPSRTGGPVPLVVALHGGAGSPERFEAVTGWSELAQRAGFAVAYPQGHRRTWNAGRCCGPARAEGVDDVRFVAALVDAVDATVEIDPARRFAVGHSNGGMLAWRLALEAPGLFAGIGVQAASPAVTDAVLAAGPAVPLSVMAVHGGGDRHHPLEGGRGPESRVEHPYRSVPESCQRFAAAAGCGPPVPAGDTQVRRTLWPAGSPGGAEVELVVVEQGTHAWMGPRAARHPAGVGGPAWAGFDTTAALWEFLSAHPADGPAAAAK